MDQGSVMVESGGPAADQPTADGAIIVRAGHATGRVVRCAISDLLLADLAVSIVFCFDRRLDEQRLAAGLARALATLPVFAGRLRERDGGLEIVCDDAGAVFSAREVGLTVAEAAGRMTLPDSGLVDAVDGAGARGGGEPLLRVRVNRLADGGTALGVSWHHAVGDMWSFMALMRAWAGCAGADDGPQASRAGAGVDSGAGADVGRASDADNRPHEPGPETQAPDLIVDDRGGFLDRILPAHDSGRTGFRTVDDAELAALTATALSAAFTNRTVQIYFTEAEATRLRDRFAAIAGCRISTNDAVTAHIVTTVRALDGDTAARSLVVPVDLRPTLGPEAAVVGNLLGEVFLACDAVEGPATGAGQASAASTAASGAAAEPSNAAATEPSNAAATELSNAAPAAERPSLAAAAGDTAAGAPAIGSAPAISAPAISAPAARTAAALRAALTSFPTSDLSLRTSLTHLSAVPVAEAALTRHVPLGFDPPNRTFTASSWRGFGAYALAFDSATPVFVSPAITLPLPWVCWLVEGFAGRGVLCTLAVPAPLAARLRSPAGRDLLHWCRAPEDAPLPPLAAAVRRLL